MPEKPPVLDYRPPQAKRFPYLLADRIVIGLVASFVSLLAVFCIVGGFYQGAEWVFGLIIGSILMVVAFLLWKAF